MHVYALTLSLAIKHFSHVTLPSTPMGMVSSFKGPASVLPPILTPPLLIPEEVFYPLSGLPHHLLVLLIPSSSLISAKTLFYHLFQNLFLFIGTFPSAFKHALVSLSIIPLPPHPHDSLAFCQVFHCQSSIHPSTHCILHSSSSPNCLAKVSSYTCFFLFLPALTPTFSH